MLIVFVPNNYSFHFGKLFTLDRYDRDLQRYSSIMINIRMRTQVTKKRPKPLFSNISHFFSYNYRFYKSKVLTFKIRFLASFFIPIKLSKVHRNYLKF